MEDISVWFHGNSSSLERLNEGTTSEEKIRAGYLKYGESIFRHMEYAFAVVLHIKPQNKWILARDRFGIEPLYFRLIKGAVKYSQFVSRLRNKKDSINYNRISEYMKINSVTYKRYDTETFYEDIWSVLPAHYMVLQDGKLSSTPYWKPKIRDFNILRDTDFFEEFRSLLIDSIEKNTASYQNIGAHLSGGMDSSSLAILYAQKKPLHTFFADGTLSSDRDQYFANLIARKHSPTMHHHTVKPSPEIYQSLYSLSSFSGYPEQFILPVSFHMSVSNLAQNLGCEAILTGHDGDTVIGHGKKHISNLFESEEWQNLNTALEVLATDLEQWDDGWNSLNSKEKTLRYKNRFFNQKIVSCLKKGDLKQVINIMRKAKDKIGYVPTSLLNHLSTSILHRITNASNFQKSLLKREFQSNSSTLSLTSDALYDIPEFDTFEQLAGATNRDFIYINEEFFALGQMHGHRYLFPFFDRKLLELSLSVPDVIKFGGGKTRALLREGLKNDLPKELLGRGGKAEFSDYLLRACIDLWVSNKDRFMENTKLWEIIDKKVFLYNVGILSNHRHKLGLRRAAANKLNKVMFLGIWLDTLNTY